MDRGQRGDSLIEVVVSCALIALVTGAIGASLIAATHRFGPDPATETLEHTVANEMRIAIDVAKYQGALLQPATIDTTAPMPSGSPLPIVLSLTRGPVGNGGTTISITATSVNNASKSATLTETVASPAPLPGTSVSSSSTGSAPQ